MMSAAWEREICERSLAVESHYTEWTSAFANLTAESLAEAMTFKEFVEVNRAGALAQPRESLSAA
jgi:hypothetical protein